MLRLLIATYSLYYHFWRLMLNWQMDVVSTVNVFQRVHKEQIVQ